MIIIPIFTVIVLYFVTPIPGSKCIMQIPVKSLRYQNMQMVVIRI